MKEKTGSSRNSAPAESWHRTKPPYRPTIGRLFWLLSQFVLDGLALRATQVRVWGRLCNILSFRSIPFQVNG